ncbi:unnamed protein product [Adineta ricciae]|uniref:G-protein coupled receptors family 1 profile domain-containing protein n=1 Tax=Adineta ricciae TaxID=249248 RepID=A0A815PZH0_ADIRI|nr:unnamed protein product [Adineta ricciae]CAF1455334.1 unnamed protein product [Adineta ricciae]
MAVNIQTSIKAALIIGVFCLIALLSLIYSLLILLIPRFHSINNIFIVNLCVSALYTSIYYIVFYVSYYLTARDIFTPNGCVMLFYAHNVASIIIPFSFVTYSVHRLCSIKCYNQPLFKTKKWIATCIATHWIGVLIISLPFVFQKTDVCVDVLWLRIYTLITAVIAPSILNITLNILIFHHARSSSLRVLPESTSNNQILNLSRREISLLRQMTFMFITFIGGWSGIYISVLISYFINFNEWIRPAMSIFGELCVVGIIINLFISNRDVRNYIWTRLRNLFNTV